MNRDKYTEQEIKDHEAGMLRREIIFEVVSAISIAAIIVGAILVYG